MTEDLMQDETNDSEFVNAFQHSDIQNAGITFEDALKRKKIDLIETNFEMFKEYKDNREFRDFMKFNANKYMFDK